MIRNHSAALEWNRRLATVMKAATDAVGCGFHRAPHIPVFVAEVGSDVARPFRMGLRCVIGKGLFDACDNGKGPILDLDQRNEIFGLVSIFRNQECNWFTY